MHPVLFIEVPVQKCDFWKVLGFTRNYPKPPKKMRLDESFRMVQVSCPLVACIKRYGQNTVSLILYKNRKI